MYIPLTLLSLRRAFCALIILAGSSVFGAPVSFYAPGELPGGDYFSQFRDATRTSEGIVAVGTVAIFPEAQGDTPVAWSPSTGWQLLASDFLLNSSGSFVCARVISADRRVIGGSTWAAGTGNDRSPCLWTHGGTEVALLGFLGGHGFPNVGVNCLSADGSVAYGFTRWSGGPQGGFRYSAHGGMTSIGFLLPDDNTCNPALHGGSGDGRVVVGVSYNNNNASMGLSAFRYTYTGGGPTGGVMAALPALPHGTFTSALGITPDAETAIGVSDSPKFPNGQLVRWDTGGHVKRLGSPNAAQSLNYAGVSADGEVVVVGLSDPITGANGVSYVRNRHGWFNLQTIISGAKVDLTGWTLDSVIGISADGRLVYGSGEHNGQGEAWVADFEDGFLQRYGNDDRESSHSDEGSDD